MVAHSDYPPAARELPVIGDAFRIDPERLAAADPDLVLAWVGGNPQEAIEQLVSRGYKVARLRTDSLEDVAANLVEIGRLAGRADIANARAREFLRELSGLRTRHAGKRRLSVFYQIAPQPLYTVGRPHPISEMIDLCGGENLFADLDQLAPVVSLEDVVARNPEVIIASADDARLDRWRRWEGLAAAVGDNLYTVDPSLVTRPGVRMLEGVEAICGHLERARRRADTALPVASARSRLQVAARACVARGLPAPIRDAPAPARSRTAGRTAG